MSCHALSESHSRSCPDTPMDVSITSGSKHSIDENLLGRLKAAGLTINESLCYDTNPTVQVMYQRYTHIFEIQGCKEKEKKQGSGSGAGKGNQREVKQKEVDSEQVDNRKKSHKNKKVTAMGR